jgi:hypothetical protein
VFLQWFRENLLQDDTQRIAKGAAGCWPRPGNTTEQQICEAFFYVLQRVTGENSVNYNTNQYYHKLIRIVHPDRLAINTVRFRVFHASMTCSALISLCIAVVRGDKVMTARKMLGILITPFAANRNAWNYPPSDFKFTAAEIAQTHLGGGNAFNEHWRGIVRAQNLEVIGAEDRFWMVNAANNVSLEQVLFRQFHRMDVTGCLSMWKDCPHMIMTMDTKQ